MRHLNNLNWDDIDIIEFRLTLEEDYNEDDEETEYIVIYDITATDKYGYSTYIDGTYDDMIEYYNVPIDIMNIIMNVFKKKVKIIMKHIISKTFYTIDGPIVTIYTKRLNIFSSQVTNISHPMDL